MTPRSPRVKQARKLQRRASRLSARQFLAEGPQAVREALQVAECVTEVFATLEATQRFPELASAAAAVDVPWQLVDDTGMGALSETVTPQGVVAVCGFLDVELAAIVDRRPALVAVCADMRDPGNAGSVLRVADAAGADAVVLAGTSVDPYNGKTVRTSVGSIFHVAVVVGVTVEEAVHALSVGGQQVLAADASGQDLDRLADAGGLAVPTAWVFGNEAHGLPAEVLALADRVVGVPVYGRAESLNLATAAAVCLYTSARAQRSSQSPSADSGASLP
jgi:TrmH family RNA methyltransferase